MNGIYIHIPFCKQACNYCNFHFTTSLQYKSDLINAICKEIALQKNYFNYNKLNTVYFGGGTPSLLSEADWHLLINTLHKYFDLNDVKEFTIEMNPDDVNATYLKALQPLGINRFSMGIQSFFDEDLLWMHRAHTAQQADKAIKLSQDMGFINLSIDLIYGTPTLSNDNWAKNLEKVRLLAVPHFSAYSLTVEPNTPLHKQIKNKAKSAISEITAAQQMQYLIAFAENNKYLHYEISNFCTENNFAIHNSNYWKGAPYLGIGPSAHSFNGNIRQSNICNNNKYIASIVKNIIPAEVEHLSTANLFNEFVMIGLRTIWGCDLNNLEQKFGTTMVQNLKQMAANYIENQSLILENNILYISPKGKLIADAIISDLFWVA